MNNNKIVEDYYDENMDDYMRNLGDCFHQGFWYNDTKDYHEALRNTNEEIMKYLNIREDDIILDAGCGVGGTVRHIIQKHKVDITGITLLKKLVDQCNKLSEELMTTNDIKFYEMDYCQTNFKDEHFTKIYALESVCHTDKKEHFIKESFRILRKNGILVVCDYFRTDKRFPDSKTEKNYDRFLDGWALAGLDTLPVFMAKMKEAGYKSIETFDKTPLVLPFSKLISQKRKAQLQIIGLSALSGKIPYSNFTHSTAIYLQYQLFKRNIFKFVVIRGGK
jgi:tocopherol O-methyltransferase